jgi:hypothetical protein
MAVMPTDSNPSSSKVFPPIIDLFEGYLGIFEAIYNGLV